MNTYLSYPWAILYGVYFYALFQVMYFLRFGSFNMSFQLLDGMLVVVGIGSVLILMYFAKKLPRKQALMFIPFLIALPFAYMGALGGGLLGAVGILLYGLVPFAVAIPLGYFVIKKCVKTSVDYGSSTTPPS